MTSHTCMMLLLLALAVISFQGSWANENIPDCCLKVSKKEIPFKNVKCYKLQDKWTGCNLKAVIFVTRRNRHLCAPPDEQWVQDLMNKLDNRKNRIICP
ncbi:C-C motif chemokine 21 [Bombina bombina]|uniref:C-C motif chemokine 21 n=1 Tax=Bombina bombina TaxID=8345 RepID=UPI00235A668E|nr:C-C motif chemokine 21 [Bombina bombina]